MTPTRRALFASGWGIALMAAVSRPAVAAQKPPVRAPQPTGDQTAVLQEAIDAAVTRGEPLVLPAGTFNVQELTLRPGSVISGAQGLTTIRFIGAGRFITATGAPGIKLAGLKIDGALLPLEASRTASLVALEGCTGLELDGVEFVNGSGNAISLTGCTGRITRCTISNAAQAAIFSLDSTLQVTGNIVSSCGNNGILVWRSTPGEDGSQVSGNRISGIRADSGGSGQNGNGVNVYRAGSVQVSGNRITDCAYSAVRGNAASDIQITNNHCQRIGEVALYAEFGFEGAMIASNIVDTAACGISVTNFNEGGRLAVVQGNLIRNLVRREQEPVDKRGEGIAVEADTLVTGNTIENAATVGILLGWGRHMRDVSATGNLIRGSRTGILISSDPAAGAAIVTGNMISGTRDGAIRAHDTGRPLGPDLALNQPTAGRVTITGNVAR